MPNITKEWLEERLDEESLSPRDQVALLQWALEAGKELANWQNFTRANHEEIIEVEAELRGDLKAALERERRLREALKALCDWHTWPEVAGAFGLAAAPGVTVTPQISEKAMAIWAQAKALLEEEKP